MIKRDLIIVSVTFCLTAALFMIVPTSGIHPYDPWIDINGDGKIDITDVAMTSGSFGTYGDSIRNVNITNWPQDRSELRLVYNQSLGYVGLESGWVYLTTVNVAGFKTLQAHAKAIGTWAEGTSITIWVCWNAYGVSTYGDSFALQHNIWYPWNGCGRTDTVFTRSDSLSIYITVTQPTNITLLTVAMYLQN